MCLSCGCGLPDEDWGDKRNITTQTIKDAAKTKEGAGYTTDEIIKEINFGWKHLVSLPDKKFSIADKVHTIGHNIRVAMKAGMSKMEAYRLAMGKPDKSGIKDYISKRS